MNRILAAELNGGIVSVALTAAIWLLLRAASRRRLNAATRYALWWAMLAIVLALPVWYLPLPALHRHVTQSAPPVTATTPPRAQASTRYEALDRSTMPIPRAAPRMPVFPVEFPAAGWPRWILAVWALASALLAGRVVASYFLLARLSARANTAPPALSHRWLALCGSRRATRVATSEEIAVPVAAGPRHPAILIPATLYAAMDEAELDHVGLHEAAHLARGDDYALLVQRIVEAVFALHPAVRWITRQIDLEREMACDDLVVATTGRTRAYATCLTRVAEAGGTRSALTAAPAAAGRSQLAHRIEHLLDRRRHAGTRLLRTRFAILLMVTAALAWFAGRTPAVVAFARPLALHLPALLPHAAEPPQPNAAAPDFDALVLEDSSGNPVPSTEVRLQRAGSREWSADLDTDREGRVRASGLAPGEYTVTFLKPNYVTASVKVQVPAAGILMRLVRYGILSGQVTDEQGRAVAGSISAPYGRTVGGARITILSKTPDGALTAVREQTLGDEGRFRVYDLPPGQYAVALWYDALPQGSGVMLYPNNEQPRFFTIAGGEDYHGIDFQILPRPVFQVSGKVQLPTPKTYYALALGLPEQPLLPIAQTLTEEDGSFRFAKVPAGSYDLFVAGPGRGYGAHDTLLGPQPSFARTRVEVNAGGVTGLDLAVAPGRSLAVALGARNAGQPPTGCPQSVSVAARLLEPWGVWLQSQQTQVAFGKQQTLADLPPGRIRLTASGLGATCYQLDPPVIDLAGNASAPVTIEIASAASVRGTLRDAGTRPADFTIVLLPGDASTSEQARIATPDSSGRFTFDSLPPGRYRIGAYPARTRWVADTSRLIEIQASGGAPTDVELPAPRKGDAQ